MKQALLIRHGRTVANERHLYCGSTDISLSESGRQELLFLRRSSIWPNIDGVQIYTSGMYRAEEKLSLLFGNQPHTAESAFREMNFGAFEMHSYKELQEDPLYKAWISGENKWNRCPGGESGEEMTARVLASFKRIISSGDVLIISHGGPIAAIMTDLFPAQGWNLWQWQPRHGTGYRVVWLSSSEQPTWERCPIPYSEQ